MEYLRKYNTATHVYIPVIKRNVVDFAVGADWTPAAGDVKVSIDGAAAANVTNLPTAITMGNTAMWDFSMTSGELQGKKINVTVADSATKAVEDQMFSIITYANASGEYAVDFSSATAFITGVNSLAPPTNWNLVSIDGSGRLDIIKINGTSQTARDIGASVLLSAGTGTGQLDFTSGIVKGNLTQILGTTLTETAGQIAAGFKKLFNVASPTAQADNLPLNTDYTSARATKLDNLDAAITSRMATFTLPTNFSSFSIDASGRVDVIKVNGTAQTARDLGAQLDATITSRMASYTQPTGFLAATFPGGTIASTTNITAGTITTCTNLTTNNDKTGYALTSGERNSIADAYLDRADAVETGVTPRQAMRLSVSADAGKVSGMATTTVKLRNILDTKDRVTATVDANGNRTAITLDLT